MLDRARADVEDHVVGFDRIDRHGARRRPGLERLGDDGIDRQHHLAVLRLRDAENAPGRLGEIVLAQRFSDRDALRGQKRIRHGAADDENVDLGDQVPEQVELGRDLGAADHRGHRPLRRFQRLGERDELRLHGAAGIGGQHVAEPFGRGMGAMGDREGVVDPDVAERGERRDIGRIVLLLADVEARVLEAEDVAVLHRRDRRFGDRADAIIGKGDVALQMLRQRRRDGLERILRRCAASGGRNARAG